MIEIDKYMGYWAQLISQDRATSWGDAVKLILAFLGFGLLMFASDRYQPSVLNSGVTIVARDSEIDEKSKMIKLLNPSIINGSQTQGVIRDFLDTHQGELSLP